MLMHLSEVTRMVLIHHDSVVVLATGVTASTRMLPVLADTTMPGTHVTALLAVLAQPCVPLATKVRGCCSGLRRGA